ncbi:MAG: CoA ester lyase [Gammaproteobacteria bacterium]|nr:CoA ester lyase [Gammaproteobacteria bacterium]
MHLVRSSLFVPGHKPDWVAKARAAGADELILDLEDAVPDDQKTAARPLVRDSVKALHAAGQYCSVRINGYATGRTLDDLEGIACAELRAVMLPKVERVEDLVALDTLLTQLERRHGIADGTIKTTLLLETAGAMRNAYDIARACPRVHQLVLAAGPGGDAARAVGYQWTKGGEETLYLRSRAVLDARAAGVPYPMISSWWDIRDLDGLRADALRNRRLGLRGMCVMHPSHVAIVNEVFSPSEAEIAHARGVLAAMAAAEAEGRAAVIYEGDMVDYAMVATARELIALAESLDAARAS